jgi:transposase
MARRQRQVPLRNNYSRDLKRRVIHLSQKHHKGSTEIALLLDMPLRVVQRVRQVWNEIGEVSRQRVRSGREPLMSREAVDVRFVPQSGYCPPNISDDAGNA